MFRFPNPVNEYAARTVAAGVVLVCLATIGFDQPWILIPITYGFWARVASGPRFSPLGQLATRVVVPRLHLEPKMVPGPPKRFAQAIGVLFSTTSLVLWYGFGEHAASFVVLGLLTVAALLESAFAICLGCRVFSQLMHFGVIPESVCVECADLTRRHPDLAAPRS